MSIISSERYQEQRMGVTRKTFRYRFFKELNKGKYCYLMLLPVIAYFVIFCYWPMSGILIAFQDYVPGNGFFSGPFVGLKHFKEFFTGLYFTRTIRNTFLLSFWSLVFGFPAPIILALMLNEVRTSWYKRIVQTITYLPHFIAIVVIAGIIHDFLSSDGLFNQLLQMMGSTEPILFLQQPQYFRTIYVVSGIWQGVGWGSIIYLSALSAIDPTLYEAAEIDGVNRWQRMWYITLPGISPTIIIMFIFAVGGLMSSATDKILLLYNPLTYETADVISTYVIRIGLYGTLDYSFATAVGLFNNVLNFLLLVAANYASRKFTETSLW